MQDKINKYDAEGNRHGLWIVYHNGVLDYKGEYFHGKRHGSWTEYWDKDIIWYKGTYKNDKLFGYLIEYTTKGNLISKRFYAN
jgi:antitoxin component YwqK of YwqJK toxin-antitoxin module